MKRTKNILKKNIGYILKRLFIAVSVIVFAFVFVGCTEAEIECGVTEDSEAYVNIRVEVECTELSGITSYDVYDAMNLIRYHYVSELGYEGSCVRVTEDSDKVVLSLRKSERADSIETAVDKLKNMLEDGQTSIFSAATLEIFEGDSMCGYSLSLALCAENILSDGQLEYLPIHGSNMIKNKIADTDAKLKVVFPATELIMSTVHTDHDGAWVTATVPISLDNPTELWIKTKVSFADNGNPMTADEKNEMLAHLSEKKDKGFIIAVVFGGTAFFMGIIISVFIVRIKRNSTFSVTEEKSKNENIELP